MYEDILLPVAPDSEATRAIPHAVSLAETYGATVHVVSVADTMERTLRGPRIGTLANRVEEAAQERVDEVAAELEAQGVATTKRVERGPPHATLLEVIEELGADVVIMPTHSRKGLERFLLGSSTEKLVRSSPVPVLTVPMLED